MKLTGLDLNKNVTQINKVAEVKEFLAEHYEIKVNEFDPNKSVIRSKSKIYFNPIKLMISACICSKKGYRFLTVFSAKYCTALTR